MGDADDLYAELGLTSGASPEAITDAYERLGPAVADAHYPNAGTGDRFAVIRVEPHPISRAAVATSGCSSR